MDEEQLGDKIKQVMNATNSGKNLDLSKIISALSSNSTKVSDNSCEEGSINEEKDNITQKNDDDEQPLFNLDMNTILKLQSLLGNTGKQDPKKNLLMSLKPFLKASKQKKINKYVSLLKLSGLAKMFIKNEGSDI